MHDGNNPLVNSTRFQSLLTFTKIGWSSKKLNTVEQKGFKLMFINILCLVFFFANVQTPGFLSCKTVLMAINFPTAQFWRSLKKWNLLECWIYRRTRERCLVLKFFRCHLELYRVILISINFKMSRKYGVFIKWNGHQVIRKAPVTRNTQSKIFSYSFFRFITRYNYGIGFCASTKFL